MFGWIVAIVLGLVCWGFMRIVCGPVTRSLSGRAARLNDKLEEFSGSYGADKVLGPASEESVARMYERMCVVEPSKWVGDPRIKSVISRYKGIVSGREKDPEGLNVPSPTILGRPNPDYQRYLKNQCKSTAHSEGLKEALKGARKATREQEIRDGFDEALRKMGMPENLIGVAITDARLDSYTEAQWRDVVKACQRVVEKYGEELAIDMLLHFTEAEILCSDEAAETFDAMCRQDIPYTVSCSVVRGELTTEQAQRAVSLVEEWAYDWDAAIKDVVTKDATESADAELRNEYAHKVNPRAKARG